LVIAVVALFIGSSILFDTASPINIVNPTGLNTNKKFDIKAEIEALLISSLFNILNGFKVLSILSSGISICFLSLVNKDVLISLFSKLNKDTIKGPIVIPKKKDVVILVSFGTIPIPQYKCLNAINKIAIGIILIKDSILFLPTRDKNIAPRTNNKGPISCNFAP